MFSCWVIFSYWLFTWSGPKTIRTRLFLITCMFVLFFNLAEFLWWCYLVCYFVPNNDTNLISNEYESYPTFWFQLHRRKLCFLKIYTHIVKIYLFSKRAWFAPNAFLAAAAVNIISILKLDFNPIQKMVTPKERKKEI